MGYGGFERDRRIYPACSANARAICHYLLQTWEVKDMIVLNFLKIAYYRLFFFFFRMFKPSPYGGRETDTFASVLAIMPLSAIVIANVYTINDILMRIVSLPSLTLISIPKVIAIISILFNYLLFFSKKRYKRIKAMFANEDKRTRHWRSFFCIVFCILSLFGIVIIDAIFGRPQMG